MSNSSHQRIIPSLIDNLAQKEPDTLWAEYPSSTTAYTDGFKQITYGQFANAVNGCATFITQALGRSGTGEPLAWLAPNDPRCTIALVAAMKARFKLFLISERNSVAANHKLFDDVQCTTILTTSRSFAPLEATRSEKELVVLELPPLESLLNEPQPEYPFQESLSAVAREVAFIVHTSGSTGFPKPMFITHEFLAKTLRNFGITAPEGYVTQTSLIEKKRCVCFLPLGHPAGVTFSLLLPLSTRSSIILPLPHIPPTGEALTEILMHINADWAALAPLTLETISKNPSLLSTLDTNLQTLVFSGGSLPKVFGDEIAKKTKLKLLSFLGSSETGPLQAIYRKGYDFESDWNYLQFPPELGARFDPRPDAGSGVYELIFEKMVETEPYQAVFASYPLQTEFRTKDLFTPHPIIPSIWTHASRSDDVIVFLNGEKVNPVDFESRVCQHPHVAAALMVGEKRFEAVLLVELVGQMQGGLSVAERARVIKMLWPVIKEANKIVPAYARVEETHVFFTEPGRPVLRTLKGTVRRKATIELYKDTIEQVYKDVEEIGTAISGRRELGSEEIQTLVREALHDTTNIGKIETSEDFFSRGMDSLQVLRLVRHLRASTALGDINPSLVYLNPSITALSTALYQLAQDGQISERKIREERMNIREQVLQKHLNAIDSLIPSDIKSTPIPQHNSSDKVVILTGSTGTIGGYILSVLLTRPDIAHIYCLNRSPDSGTLQAQRNAQQDSSLPLTFPGSKVTFLTVDLTHPTLSLEDAVYESLKKRTTHVIHNAWKVDFNLPLQSFEAQLGGTVNLIRLCADASHTPTLVFISSVSAAMNFSSTISSPENPTPIPETILFDLATPAPAGYAESKYIAERLLAHAAKTLSITSKVLRLGQIAGAAKSLGRWNSADWVPALILGSRELSAIPDKLSGFDDESMIDWAPVDAIAEVIVEIGVDSTAEPGPDIDGKNGNGSISVFHALNPHREPWSSLLPSIISALESDSDSRGPEQKRVIEIVSPSEWVSRLRAAARRPSPADQKEQASVDVNPALRLFEFFSERFGGSGTAPESLGWETGNAEMLSKTLREVEGIDGGLMGRWVAQWMEGEK